MNSLDSRCPFLMQKNYLNGKVFHDKLHHKAIKSIKCTDNVCTGSFLFKSRPPFTEKSLEDRRYEAINLIDEFYESINKLNSEEHLNRKKEILKSIDETGFYELTETELDYGTKTAWRNASRCPGRIFWSQLKLIDARDKRTPKEMFDELCNFLKNASEDKSNIKNLIIVFPQRKSLDTEYRVWNSQLISYAGYELNENTVIGDRAQIEFTKICLRLGWKGKGTEYDVLPLVIQADGKDPEWFELPKELILEAPIVHPKYDFDSLNLKYFPVVSFSTFLFDIGGCIFTCAPFSAYYSAPEISRAIGDYNRYNKLKLVAEKIGLDTRNNSTLWKDKALIELNYAILYSFMKENISVIDHHTMSEQFIRFFENEHKLRGGCPADWVWVNPQMSTHLEDAFYLEMLNYKLLPSIDYQISGWKIKTELNKLNGKNKKNKKFKQTILMTLFASILMKKVLNKRVKCTILYGTETRKSELYADNLIKLFNYAFNTKVYCMNEYNFDDFKKESLVIVITSTYGNGDPPSNAKRFSDDLIKLKHEISKNIVSKKDYENIRYGVFALGSTKYPKFCAFGKSVNTMLDEIGLKRVVDIGLGDEEEDQDNSFKLWSIDAFKAFLVDFTIDINKLDSTIFNQIKVEDTRWTGSSYKLVPVELTFKPDLIENIGLWHKKKLIKCLNTQCKRINHQNSEKTILFSRMKTLDTNEVLNYKPGDHVGIVPYNNKDLVDFVLSKCNESINFDKYIKVEKLNINSDWINLDIYPKFTLRQALTNFLDITSPLKQHLIKCLIEQAHEEIDKNKLRLLSENKEMYEAWKKNKYPSLKDLLEEFPSLILEPSFLIVELPKLQPRYYSISSWPKEKQNYIDLTLGVIEYKPIESEHVHYGVCSKWIENLDNETIVPIFIREANNFHLPQNKTDPIILISTGTGIAPFRSFWEKRKDEIKSNNESQSGEMFLYFGSRYSKYDDIYKAELDELQSTGVIKSVTKAWSRDDSSKKFYVQDALEKDANNICNLIFNKQAHIYICGEMCMANDVGNRLIKIICEYGKMDNNKGIEFLNKLRDESRYHEDIYNVLIN